MSGWDAKTWVNVVLTGFYVLVGLALLLWPPEPGKSWWSWQRLFGAAVVIAALAMYPILPNPTRGGLISNGIVWIGMGLWLLFAGVWSVNGPDLPPGELLRQRWKPAALFLLFGGTNIALILILKI